MKINERFFGHDGDQAVVEYSLFNDSGMIVSCLNYGCVITKIIVPDRIGNFENVVLGFETFEEYKQWSPYFGAVVGRVAGRIKNARFELDGKEYLLAANEFTNHLHGGKKGFSSVLWKVDKLEEDHGVGLRFSYRSPTGEEGYPGNLDIAVTYLLTNNNELHLHFEGKTDQTTLVNLTNHSYFNLSGNVKRDCTEHKLQLESDSFLELGEDLIPTGKLIDSMNTPFDFQQGKCLKEGMNSSYPQNVLVGKGYDHPLVFTKKGKNSLLLSDEASGRILEVSTNQPAVVLYTSNQLEGPFSISGVQARNYLGVCLETQGLPDAIHHPEFPTVVLKPGDVYDSTTKYRFYYYN